MSRNTGFCLTFSSFYLLAVNLPSLSIRSLPLQTELVVTSQGLSGEPVSGFLGAFWVIPSGDNLATLL